MAEQAQVSGSVSLGAKIIYILLAGALSMFFAEVFSGSSILWFLTSWAWMVTFWLYLAHLVFFINLAFIFKRTSLTSLYLWGVFFGLYESWITKVTWAGYAGSTPGWGHILGFAFPEFPLIVLFWHPIMSFIIPVLTFEIMSGEKRILPGHLSILTKTGRNWALALLIAFLGALFLSANAHGNFVAVDVTIIGSIALIAVLYRVAIKRYPGQFSIESLKLGKIGMTILIAYLAALYLFAFFFILPERTGPPLTILLTLVIYVIIGILLYLNGADKTAKTELLPEKSLFGMKELVILLAVFFILATALSFVTPFDFIVLMFFYLSLFAVGIGLLAYTIWNVLKGRRKNPTGPT